MAHLLFLFAIVICSIRGHTLEHNLPEIDASICESQPHGAKIPNPVDCGSFYVCDRQYPEIMFCNDGLLFDVNLQVCNWAEDTTCIYSALPTKPIASIHQKPGNLLNEKPQNSSPEKPQTVLFQNPETLLDQKLETGIPQQQDAVAPPKTADNEATNQRVQEQSVYNPVDIEIFNPDSIGCSRDGIYYLPHPTDCEYYFLCISRTLHKNYCGMNMHWDYRKQICDHPDNSVCYAALEATIRPEISITSSQILKEPSTYVDTTQTESTTPSTTIEDFTTLAETITVEVNVVTEDADITEDPLILAPPQSHLDGYDPNHVRCIHDGFYFLPHPTSCEIYFICINHTLHFHRCGPHIHWDYIDQHCTVPTLYRCYASSLDSKDVVGDIGPENPLEGFEPEHVRCIHSGFYYLPHPSNCNLYFVCSNYTLHLHRCGYDSTWNFQTEICTAKDRKCYFEVTGIQDEDATTLIPTETGKEGGKNFDPMEEYDPNNIQCIRGGFYFLPHPTNCEFYFICMNRTLNLQRCGNDILWNYPDQRCDLPKNSKCYVAPTTVTAEPVATTTPSQNKTTPAPTKQVKTTRNPTTRPSTTTTTTAKPRSTVAVHMPFEVEKGDQINDTEFDEKLDILPKCPKHQAFYPHGRDCRKYYICIGGVPIMTKCPDDLYWDAQERMCGLPSHTKCNLRNA